MATWHDITLAWGVICNIRQNTHSSRSVFPVVSIAVTVIPMPLTIDMLFLAMKLSLFLRSRNGQISRTRATWVAARLSVRGRGRSEDHGNKQFPSHGIAYLQQHTSAIQIPRGIDSGKSRHLLYFPLFLPLFLLHLLFTARDPLSTLKRCGLTTLTTQQGASDRGSTSGVLEALL